tara:strand:+ start:2194 stop:3069 length:876 start_codon:yes stop_codon:yes gene_type:complete
MKHLPELITGDKEAWIDIALESRKNNVGELRNLREDLIEAYNSYDKLIDEHTKPLEESVFLEEGELLVDYYESPPKNLKGLLQERRNAHGLLECPFCGYPMVPDTLDHFIPKTYWPEFSIHSDNLVPQCRGCAPTKGDRYFCNEEEAAIFLHPFFNNLLSRIRFNVTVLFDAGDDQPSFQITLKTIGDIEEDKLQRLKVHLKKLKAKQRFILYCHREYQSWKTKKSKSNFDITYALNARLLEVEIGEQGKDWKSALYRGMLDNQELINFLNLITPEDGNQVEVVDEEAIDF